MTHEEFIHQVRAIVAPRVNDEGRRAKLLAAKLVYGSGRPGTRGITYYQGWANGDHTKHDFVEVCAGGEKSPVQVAGTTLHELGHCLAGWDAGHGSDWKLTCATLGLARAEASEQSYAVQDFAPEVWSQIAALGVPDDGRPSFQAINGVQAIPFQGMPLGTPRPCPLGIGTRGGKSRGVGSGSRLRLWVCGCHPAVKARVASDEFKAHCDACGESFKQAEAKSVPKVDTAGSPATNPA